MGIGVATGAYGLSFGAISVASGLDVWQTQFLSLAMFTGASQFALVGILGTGGGALVAVVTALLLGARNSLYALSLRSFVTTPRRPSIVRTMGQAQLTIDESTAMAIRYPEGSPQARHAFWATGIAIYVLWNLGTLIGALGAAALDDPRTLGLDAAGAGRIHCAAVAPTSRPEHDRPGLGERSGRDCACSCAASGASRPVRGAGRTRRRAVHGPEARMIWPAVIVGSLGAYLLKLSGYVIPERVLDNPRLQRLTTILPIALLAALVGVQTFSTGDAVQVDARVAGLAAAIVALALRAPFLVVILVAAATAAVLRGAGLAP